MISHLSDSLGLAYFQILRACFDAWILGDLFDSIFHLSHTLIWISSSPSHPRNLNFTFFSEVAPTFSRDNYIGRCSSNLIKLLSSQEEKEKYRQRRKITIPPNSLLNIEYIPIEKMLHFKNFRICYEREIL